MNKLIMILPIIGVLFLIIFWVMSPGMGPALVVTIIPFIIVAGYLLVRNRKETELRQEQTRKFQSEKEEILKEIKRKDKRQQEQSGLLRGFCKDLAAALNKEQLLRLIVTMFSKTTKSVAGDSQCFLLSLDSETNEFHYEVGDNFDNTTLKATKFSTKDEIIENVMKSKKISTYISDIFGADSNVHYFIKEERASYMSQIGSLALVPLVLEDNVWGIIVIFCSEESATRIRNEEDFFLQLVAQASIALGSAIHRGLAAVDRLTQLYNRTFLQKRMREEIEFCNRQLLPLSVLMIDIDNFKEINDTYGHQEGDMVLKKIAQILSTSVRLTDICARYGGEEFVLVLPGIAESPHDRFSIGERVRGIVERSDFVINETIHLAVTVSIGVSVRQYPEDKNVEIDELIKRADDMLYKAKRSGKNRVCYPENVEI
ncbi:MAG: diguanylate cyclase [Candidatus Omnitrophica bacterium]|nr:diguanylate cyclase [Candidatus Omnitrophota bacterium]